MGTPAKTRMTTAEEQAQPCPTAEAVPASAVAENRLSAEDIRDLREFFGLLDRWDRELHQQ